MRQSLKYVLGNNPSEIYNHTNNRAGCLPVCVWSLLCRCLRRRAGEERSAADAALTDASRLGQEAEEPILDQNAELEAGEFVEMR